MRSFGVDLRKSQLALIAAVAVASPAIAQAPNIAVAQAVSQPLGPRVQAIFADLGDMFEALMEVMGVAGDAAAQQQIIAILIGYRSGEIGPKDAKDSLNALAVNGFWGSETVNEIIARVRVAQALTGDWNGDGEYTRTEAVAFLVKVGVGANFQADVLVDVDLVLSALDQGDIDLATAINRLGTYYDESPVRWSSDQDPSPFVEETLAQGVVDTLAGGEGNGGVTRIHLEAAVRSIAADR